MRRISFSLTLLSLFMLFLLLNLPPKTVLSTDSLSSFQPNQKFVVSGNVIKETYSKNYKTLFLDNELQLKCPLPCPPYLNKNISALAILEFYNGEYSLKVLKIKTL